jgi:hypothetical protein
MYTRFALLLACVALAGCKPKNDDAASAPPSVRFVTPTQAVLNAEAEQSFHVIVEYSDDVALAEVGGAVLPAAWAFSYTRAQAGPSVRDTLTLTVPAGLPAGPYLFTVYAKDADGQRAEATLTFNVQNELDTQAPFVTLDAPAQGATFAPGARIPVVGTATDNRGLATLYAVLRRNSTVLDERLFTLTGAPLQYALSDSLRIPDTLSIGTYEVRVTALDTAGNSVYVVRNVVVN